MWGDRWLLPQAETDGTHSLCSANPRRLVYHTNLLYDALTDGAKPQAGPP
jgi:hypothetical protein